MTNRKRLHLLVVLVLVLSAFLAACGGNSENQTANNGENRGQQGEEGGNEAAFEFSYFMPTQYANWLRDKEWLPILEERTNTKVDIQDGGNGDQYYNNVDLRIGGQNFTDTGIVNLTQANVYGTQGAFVDLKPIIDEHAPNLKRYIEENPEYENLITSDDGAIYGIIAEYPKIAEVILYREDMFEKAGIESLPRTIEQFTDVLRTLKAHYGANDPNFYPYMGREGFIKFTEVFNAADGIRDGKVHGIYQNGRGFNIYDPGFKELVEWHKTLYDEGLIDPEWVAGAASEESWQTKMLNGKGAISYDYYTRPVWFMQNGGPENDPDYSMNVIPYLLDTDGNQSKVPLYFPQYRTDRMMVVNASAADKAEGVIKFLDYLYSEEGQELVTWGIEGETYEVVDGEKQYIIPFSETFKPIGEKRWDFVNDQLHFPKPVDNEAFYKWNEPLVQQYASELFTDEYLNPLPVLKYTTEQMKERTSLLSQVEPAVLSNVVKFVTGDRPMSEWDSFLAEMESAGYKKIVEIDQAAYDAMQDE